MEFRYAGLDPRLEALRPGGRLSFRTMPNGLVLIDRWVIRMASFEPDTMYDVRTHTSIVTDWPLPSEAGGELAHATWAGGLSWHASLGRLRVHAVTDSGAPAAGTFVRLLDTHYRGRTDSAGNVEIGDLVPGPYSLVVVDPQLAELNLELATGVRFVAVRDSTVWREFRVPTAADTTAKRCSNDSRNAWRDSVRAPTIARQHFVKVLGRVLTADGQPVGGVEISLKEFLPPPLPDLLLARYTTGTDGLFQFCLPTLRRGMMVSFRASTPTWSAAPVVRRLVDEVTIVRIPFPP
jgi:hypothetical protein